MKNVKIIMECKLSDKEDIEMIFNNFSASYPEVKTAESIYEDLEKNSYRFKWEGTIADKYEDGIIKLTHHAEGIYEDTSAEYVHVEVCIDEKWYGKYKGE